MSSFYKDLARGQKIEREMLILVQKKYPDAYLVEGYCKEWDIFIPSEEKGVEVKYDPMSQKTGNIVVEVEYNDKPSALMTTKAYRWIFHTGKELILTTPKRIMEVVDKYTLSPACFKGPGDPHYKKAYLIKKHQLKETAIRCKEIK